MLHETFCLLYKRRVQPVKIVLAGIIGKHSYLFCRESDSKGNGFQSVHLLDLNKGYPVIKNNRMKCPYYPQKDRYDFCRVVNADLSIHYNTVFSVKANEMNNEQIMLAIYNALLENAKKLEER